MTALPVLFLLVDSVGKFARPEPVVRGTVELGYSEAVIVPLGMVLLASTIVHLVPQTAVLGAILLTGYLGGAVSTHLRVGSPLFTHILFPVYFGLLIWGGLYLREERLRNLVQTGAQSAGASKKMLWAGWIASVLPVLMLLMSATMKFLQPPPVAEGFAHLGYPIERAYTLGILELACTILFLVPRTSVLGAMLLTGYLGGAVATHVRIGEAFVSPVVVAVLAWLGLYLRDARVRELVPLRKSA
jgi:hypothetical protein